ncbi:potential E3 ubiquitin-protein ligase ariadne-2-like [Pempheris klunzingeri]|uniref:potential E3 ubiquitin-protein ligase ariadne-2-like n=1 Tax=Pempheris klunzingeri TaxID=3127111 RepID=UPI00397FFE1D
MAAKEKCYNCGDKTLIFVNGDDELDFLCNDYKSPRAKMSCGHAVTPMSLTDWCSRLLDRGECRFVCGQTRCDVEWPFEEVCKMALLTPSEKEDFEKRLFSNAKKDYLDIKACPGCNCLVERTSLSDLSVKCTVCTANKKRTYKFCWQCLKEWKGSARCENDGCTSNALAALKNCGNLVFESVTGVPDCPSFRACPTCGMLLEHNKKQCKNIVCPRCKAAFCFVCLKLTKECLSLSPGSYFKPCSTGVAPRQTSIPAWHGK